ncbi:hypothetical protein Ctha_0671 [Chloroherpeton thalassium ATCC 35110]|uniref:Flavinylation-associated cytochrome domain-containing protein n=2 Tax=Chloroherpeton thalassium TaxID=100716 RepID=B3QVT3_CHLT3|nr:hypothetical protein Ctha_0671 [Chloroherpeton thalassium ATCC 35110]
MNMKSARPFVTATVTMSFVILSITGVLMTFHVFPREQTHMLKGIHEWLGYLFIIGAGFHLYFNWSAILGYFKQRHNQLQWLVAGLVCIALSIGAFVFNPDSKRGQGEGRHRAQFENFERHHSSDLPKN